jgi:hypothetical protein
LYDELLERRITKFGPNHPDSIDAFRASIQAYQISGDFARAASLYEQLWAIQKQSLPAGHRTRIDTQNLLGLHLVLAGRFAEAEPHLRTSYEDGVRARGFPEEWRLAYTVRLFALYAEWNKPAEVAHWRAESKKYGDEGEARLSRTGLETLQASRFRAAELLLRDCLAIQEKTRPEAWNTFDTKSMLGGALLGLKNYADAEPLLLAGYEGMKQRQARVPPDVKARLTEAVSRLVQLYEALGNNDEARKWRNELEEQQRTARGGESTAGISPQR